ncbi:hypothetical protein ECFRIK2001_3296, partial [Escherichia coli FRIK2001]
TKSMSISHLFYPSTPVAKA